MAALHEALANLSPTDWSNVPQENLEPYIQGLLTSAELICSSIPPPPNGTPYADSRPALAEPNTATSHKDMHASASRSLPAHQEYEELQSQWGKPMKFSAKDNPLELAIYKTAGKDRHGGWFARRSVHEGIGFTKFRDAMKREFEEALLVEGGPGAGCIRGIGADKKLEEIDIAGLGHLEVLQLSAQFPGPTTPREFVTLLITSETALTEKTVARQDSSSGAIPRHFIVISRPIKHPDAPERSSFVRGQYESVELIREIPLSDNSFTSDQAKGDGLSNGHASKAQPELNPVEWIMITRSDPGGGIPRFMVDRGTPSAMIADVHKFLDWAAKAPATDSQILANEKDESCSDVAKDLQDPPVVKQASPESQQIQQETQEAPNGVFQQLTKTLEDGLDAYAPAVVSSFIREKFDTTHDVDESDLSSDSDSDSFISATEKGDASVAKPTVNESSESVSLASVQAADNGGIDKKPLTHYEKKLLEISKARDKLERQLAKKRQEEQTRLQKAQESEESDAAKARERYEKEMQKQEDKHRRGLEKLEAKQKREAQKLEEKKKKQLDRDTLHKLTRERDEFKEQVDLLNRENAVLREKIEHLEATNGTEHGDSKSTLEGSA